MQKKFSHIDDHGQANMVDISQKEATSREALAEGFIAVCSDVFELIEKNDIAKGDVFSVSRVAGIQAAKNCANLIPLCHPLLLTKISIEFELLPQENRIRVQCMCKLNGTTGVEMEALTGVSIALLTLFDMCKAVDPTMTISGIRVLKKMGGKSGDWHRE